MNAWNAFYSTWHLIVEKQVLPPPPVHHLKTHLKNEYEISRK